MGGGVGIGPGHRVEQQQLQQLVGFQGIGAQLQEFLPQPLPVPRVDILLFRLRGTSGGFGRSLLVHTASIEHQICSLYHRNICFTRGFCKFFVNVTKRAYRQQNRRRF